MARLAAQFYNGILDRPCLLVHAVGSHGIVAVDEGKNPRCTRDRLSSEAYRVARPVPAFMMRSDDGDYHLVYT